MKPSRILIADDHPIVVLGLSKLVESIFPNVAVDSATTLNAIRECVASAEYDLCLLDIEMPGACGTEILPWLRGRCPQMKIVVNTIHDEPWCVKEYIAAGVEGISFKSSDPGELAGIIRRVAAGERCYCSSAAESLRLLEGMSQPTERELQVLSALVAGKTTECIARELYISQNTAETHRRHLLEKFDAANTVELIAKAVRLGFVTF